LDPPFPTLYKQAYEQLKTNKHDNIELKENVKFLSDNNFGSL